jgi:hypothetical protein
VSRGGAGDLLRGADGLSRGKVVRRATSWSLGGSGGDQRVVGDVGRAGGGLQASWGRQRGSMQARRGGDVDQRKRLGQRRRCGAGALRRPTAGSWLGGNGAVR